MDSIKIERADVSENGALNDVTEHTKLNDMEEMESCSLVDKAQNAPSIIIDESDPKNNQCSDDNIDHGDTDLETKIVKYLAEEQLSDLNNSKSGTGKQAPVQECVVVGTQCDEEKEDLSENCDSKKNVVYDLQNKCGDNEGRKQTKKHKSPIPETGSCRFKREENVAKLKFFEEGVPFHESDEEDTPFVNNDKEAAQNDPKENSKGSPTSDKNIQNQWSFMGLKKRQFIICVIINLVGIFICSTTTGIIVSILINKNCEDTCIRMSEQKQSATPPLTHFDSIELLIWNDTAFVTFSSGKYNITRVIYDNKRDIVFCKKTNTIVCGKADTADCEMVPEDKIYSTVKKVTYQVDMQCVNKSYSLIWTPKRN